MRVVVISVDGLRPDYLGCYGCDWISTPNIDQLASDGIVFDNFYADRPRAGSVEEISQVLSGQEIPISQAMIGPDSEDPASWKAAIRTIGTAIQPLKKLDNGLLWLNINCLIPPWNPPDELLVDFFLDDDESESESQSETEGDGVLPWFDPLPIQASEAELDRISRTYAASVRNLDSGLGQIWKHLTKHQWGPEATWIVTSFQGFPLGEHGSIGVCNALLHEELIHLPLVMRSAESQAAQGGRNQTLLQPQDWLIKVAMKLGANVISRKASDRLLIEHEGRLAVRTSEYLLVNDPKPRLYSKPEDRFEVNDISQQFPDVVDCLLAEITPEARKDPARPAGGYADGAPSARPVPGS